MATTPARGGGARKPEDWSDTGAQDEAKRADTAWQAARQRVADRNAAVRKRGRKDRREHDDRIAAARRAAGDASAPPTPPAL